MSGRIAEEGKILSVNDHQHLPEVAGFSHRYLNGRHEQNINFHTIGSVKLSVRGFFSFKSSRRRVTVAANRIILVANTAAKQSLQREEKRRQRNGKKVGSGSRYKREVQGNYGFRSS